MVSSIKEAKERVVAEKNKIVTAWRAIIGSRAVLAVLTILMVGFGSHILYAPTRLPPIEGLSLAQVGLPPSLDLGVLGDAAKEARDAAMREGAPAEVNSFLTENAAQIPLMNWIGFGVCLLLLIWNLFEAAKKWKTSTGVTIGAA